MAVRCIFNKNTGELIEFNTQRNPDDNEIIGYWSNISYPKNGLIYDTTTNTVRERTDEEAKIDNMLLSDVVCTVYPINQIIKPKAKTKILFANIDTCTYVDSASVIHLPLGQWSIQGTLTLNGLHSVRYCTITWTIDGVDIYKKTFGGLVFHHFGWYSIEFSRILSLQNNSQLELWIECDKFVRIIESPTSSSITFHYVTR